MTPAERHASMALAGIFTLRMLGLFMIFPIFSLDAHLYSGNTAMLTGLAIGIYGLTQVLFQIPFGRLSDRIGRKRLIVGGMLVQSVAIAWLAAQSGAIEVALSNTVGTKSINAIQGSGESRNPT